MVGDSVENVSIRAMSERVEHIDVAKGISITMVAVFHSELTVFFASIIEPMSLFRMPLFFFLSGVFFTFKARPALFLWKKSEALLKPYLSVSLLLLVYYAWLEGAGEPVARLMGILYGNGATIQWEPMWFLTHLFAVYCLAYGLFRYAGLRRLPALGQWLCLAVFLLTGVYTLDAFWQMPVDAVTPPLILPGLPFSLDILLVTSAFFMAGRLLKGNIVNMEASGAWLGLFLLVYLSVAIGSDAYLDLNRRFIVDPLLSVVGAVSGICVVLHISLLMTRLSGISSAFILLGKSSLYILIFHDFIGDRTYTLLSRLAAGAVNDVWLAFFAFLISILLPLLIKVVVERSDLLSLFFLPFRTNRLLNRALYLRR